MTAQVFNIGSPDPADIITRIGRDIRLLELSSGQLATVDLETEDTHIAISPYMAIIQMAEALIEVAETHKIEEKQKNRELLR